MRVSEATVNRLIDTMGASLDGGALVFYDGRPPRPSEALEDPAELVRVLLPVPAFHPAEAGKATSHDLPDTLVGDTGEARWARLLTSGGLVVADLVVRAQEAPDRASADILVDRTDFHRGGVCRLQPLILTMPRSS